MSDDVKVEPIDPKEAGDRLLETARLMSRVAQQLEGLGAVLFSVGYRLGGDLQELGLEEPNDEDDSEPA